MTANGGNITMNTPGVSAPAWGRIRPDCDLDGLAAFLRRAHGNHSTAFHVEAKTGIPAETVRNWLKLRDRPGFAHFWILAWAYGPKLCEAALTNPPPWLAAATRQAEIDALRSEQLRLSRELRRLEAGEACDGST